MVFNIHFTTERSQVNIIIELPIIVWVIYIFKLCIVFGESILSVFLVLASYMSNNFKGARESLGEAKHLFAPLKYAYATIDTTGQDG